MTFDSANIFQERRQFFITLLLFFRDLIMVTLLFEGDQIRFRECSHFLFETFLHILLR